MSIEMWSVAALSLILLALTAVQGVQVPLVQGLKWGHGSRDDPREETVLQGRFSRTVNNHVEAMLIFVPLMLLAIHQGISNDMTRLSAQLVIGGRLAFIPLYLAGVFALRSLAFGVSLVGVAILVVQLL